MAELLVAIAILGVAIVALVGGVGDAIASSVIHRSHASADAEARSAAEQVKERIGTYAWNANGAYTVSGAAITAQCATNLGNDMTQPTFGGCPGPDLGLQMLTVSVSGPKGVTETFQILKRKT